ncbi:MAG: MFS transporter [Thermomicrobiales bacterium]
MAGEGIFALQRSNNYANSPAGIFYGWWIVSAGIGSSGSPDRLDDAGVRRLRLSPQADFGWSKTALSAPSRCSGSSGILGPAQGWMLTRYGPRNVMRVGIVMFGIGFLLFSQINSLLTFYLVFLLMAVGAVSAGSWLSSPRWSTWFDRKRSTAMGVAYTGLSLGGLVVPLVAWSLDTVGWRTTAVISGILVLSLGLPLTSLVRTRPRTTANIPTASTRQRADSPGGNLRSGRGRRRGTGVHGQGSAANPRLLVHLSWATAWPCWWYRQSWSIWSST